MFKRILLLFTQIISVVSISWLHFSDIHVDINYKLNAPSKCLIGTKLGTKCCSSLSFPISNTQKCQKFGDMYNDSPMDLVSGIFNWSATNLKNIDLIINTGDSGSHKDVSQFFTNSNKNSMDFVSNELNKYFPTIPSLNVIGNHDSYPTVDQTFPGYKLFLSHVTKPWLKWINDNNMSQYGYYTYKYNSYTFVVLNNLYYDTENLFGINNTNRDRSLTNSQFVWLDNVLSTNDNIILIYHIPFMGGEANEYFNKNIKEIYTKYNQKILLTLNGHSHTDHFLLFTEINSSDYFSFSLVNPSVVPDNHFPMFRVYTIDEKSNNIDYIQYYCDLDISNKLDNLQCFQQYKFSSLYNISSISLNNMILLYEKMHTSAITYNDFIENYAYPTIDKNFNYYNEIINYI